MLLEDQSTKSNSHFCTLCLVHRILENFNVKWKTKNEISQRQTSVNVKASKSNLKLDSIFINMSPIIFWKSCETNYRILVKIEDNMQNGYEYNQLNLHSTYLCLIDNMNVQIIQPTETTSSSDRRQYLSYGRKNTSKTVKTNHLSKLNPLH